MDSSLAKFTATPEKIGNKEKYKRFFSKDGNDIFSSSKYLLVDPKDQKRHILLRKLPDSKISTLYLPEDLRVFKKDYRKKIVR